MSPVSIGGRSKSFVKGDWGHLHFCPAAVVLPVPSKAHEIRYGAQTSTQG